MKIGKYNIHLHSMSTHFTNALYPVAVFFLVLFKIYDHDPFRSTYSYLLLLALASSPVTFATGIIEWQQKYKGAKVRIFIRKRAGGIVLMCAGSGIAGWNYFSPDIVTGSGTGFFIFMLLNVSIIPLVGYLGYLGGKLVFGGSH